MFKFFILLIPLFLFNSMKWNNQKVQKKFRYLILIIIAMSLLKNLEAVSSTLDDIAEAIANPPPNRPLIRQMGIAGRQMCESFSAVAPWVREAAGVAPGLGPFAGLGTIANVCQPYLDSQGYDPPELIPPYSGGQCMSAYTVFATTDGVDLFIGGQTPLDIMGPLGAVTATEVLVGFPQPDSTRFEWRFAGDPMLVLQFTARKSLTPDPGFRIAGRVDGGPDDCGDPPLEIEPGSNPAPDPGPFPPGENPGVDPTGEPFFFIPDVPTPFGDFPLPTDPTDPPPDGGPPALPPGDQGEPGEPEEAGDEDAEGCAEEGQVLVGLRLQLIEAGPRAKVFAGGVFRGAAYIYMGGDVSLDQDFAGSLLIEDQFIYAEKDNLTCWRVMANAGFRWTVTPHYRAFE